MATTEQQPRIAFYTLGCRTNQLESSALADAFTGKGWTVVPFDESAHYYVVNTCTVTEGGDSESRRIIRRARLSNPEAKVVVTGCYAQVNPQAIAGLDGVSMVIGNNQKDRLVEIVEQNQHHEGTPLITVGEIDKSRMLVSASSAGIDRTRGSLKIQDGCDFKCTYCIIWEARGASRSLPVEDVKVLLARMVSEGFKEIVLTGINIGQYDDNGRDLADLLAELVTIPGDYRLRLSSLDPVEVTDKLLDVVAAAQESGKICPHFHLAAQACEDSVLKRMARRHRVADFEAVCAGIVARMPDAAIASDIIVGFPGETDEQFEHTYRVLEASPISYLHVFGYSRRSGTPAATYRQVDGRVIKVRTARLIELSKEKSRVYRERFVGKSLRVLVESSGLEGTSENFIRVGLDVPENLCLLPNQWKTARVTRVDERGTWAEMLEP